ncbi:hypothetical protein [uncultured Eubacterium sp.]|uniref:hypothetical protein n=1 Tax=uncultured Eubacterium sp. TaxID=165185 RepID=UPI0025961BDF|nr:hypothetical protein [uncultured Eubacterium sp.]
MIRKICPKCATVAWKNSDNKCRFCESDLIKISILQSIRLNDIKQDEITEYITQKILNGKLDYSCVQIRDEKIKLAQKSIEEHNEQKAKEKEAEYEKIKQQQIQYQNKYLSFVKEAEEQGIPRGRAEVIATNAMQHKMYSLPRCPGCGSVDASKISTGTKVAKTAAFGVIGAMSDTGKTWKCNRCGSKW